MQGMPEIRVPVYLFTGFLEAGKTRFIQQTLEDKRFNTGERTLVILCEEGEEELDTAKMSSKDVTVKVIEDESELTEANLNRLCDEAGAQRILVEYNGMWQLASLFNAMPADFGIYQEICIADASTFVNYNANIRSLVVDKLQTAELIVFNRYSESIDMMELHKICRGVSRGINIAYEYTDGRVQYDDIEDPLLRYTAGEQMMIADYRQLTKSHQYVMDKTLSALKVAELVDECPDIKKLILFDKSLAAGIGDPTEFDDKGEPIYVYSNPMVKRADCVFYVNGDSMEPKFLSGDMVLVQRFPDCGSANPGDIGAFITHNETYIKEYRKDGLHSLNSAYPTMKFDEDDDVFFIGKVIGILDPYEDIASEEDLRKYQLVYGEDD